MAALLDGSGVDAATLATALQSIAEAKQSTAPEADADKSIYQDKSWFLMLSLLTFLGDVTLKEGFTT